MQTGCEEIGNRLWLISLCALILAACCIGLRSPASAQSSPTGQLSLPDGAAAYVPARMPRTPPPLLVLLHGAGQSPAAMIARFQPDADRLGLVLLAPRSRGASWDVIAKAQMASQIGPSSLGAAYRYIGSPDGERIAAAEAGLAKLLATDPVRRVLLGFSDGATFALAYGTDRARAYAAVIAVAPGLAVVPARPARGRRVLILHGRGDRRGDAAGCGDSTP